MRYFLHLRDGEVVSDVDGEDHADARSAAAAAARVMGEALHIHQDRIWDSGRLSIAVKDETGRLVAILTTTGVFDAERNPLSAPTF